MIAMIRFFVPNVPRVHVDEVKKAIDAKEDCVLLDVRTQPEYTKGHIVGSTNLPVDEVVDKVEGLLPDKNKKIFVYCFSGSRSVLAVEAMVKLGYTNVYDLKSGILAWRAKGFPL